MYLSEQTVFLDEASKCAAVLACFSSGMRDIAADA